MINQTIIEFSGGNVPIPEVAKIMKKDKQFIRIGIQENWHPIGVAYKKEGSSEYSYYVSPKKLMSILDISIRNKNQMCNFNNCTFLFYYFLIYDFGERSGKYEIT